MSQVRSTRVNQIATPEAVAAVCDALFREGEKITEATVRARLGGGSTTTILKLIREWDDRQRREFLELRAKVAEYEVGDAPPSVPKPLWDAIRPVWRHVLDEAKAHAEKRLASDWAALEVDRQALVVEAERVSEADARWQQEKRDLLVRVDSLNGEAARQKTRVTELAQDLIQAGKEATAQSAVIDGLREQLERAERALAAAQEILVDLRVELERTKMEASAAKTADARSQAEIERLREDLRRASY